MSSDTHTRLYTRLGDNGKTYCIITGERVSKSHPCIEFVGVLDEAEAWLGFAASLVPERFEEVKKDLDWMQSLLFRIGFSLSGELCVEESDVKELERITDKYSEALEPLFTLNGGHPAAAAISIARTVVRRLERRLAACLDKGVSSEHNLLRYMAIINRMSDALYAMSIWLNKKLGIKVRFIKSCR
ncbi:MAG: cob(I)yrinic acid a,c-diamide adenosyltransferase [Pyrodictiaceae archaeon]